MTMLSFPELTSLVFRSTLLNEKVIVIPSHLWIGFVFGGVAHGACSSHVAVWFGGSVNVALCESESEDRPRNTCLNPRKSTTERDLNGSRLPGSLLVSGCTDFQQRQ
uniref:Uncharacterized protein n=1 Tax=Sphaerodactylus townsendi TaxID=933632 RepID=A0ACB8EFT1_9SAUR